MAKGREHRAATLPWRGAPWGLALCLALLLAVALPACFRPTKIKWAWGRYLVMGVSDLRTVPYVAYSDGQAHYVIRPLEEGQELVVALLTIRNEQTARASLQVGERSAYLEDPRGRRYYALDPLTQRQAVPSPLEGEGEFTPFLWGHQEVPQGYQVEGWMVFQVPRGTRIARVVWDETDYISLLW